MSSQEASDKWMDKLRHLCALRGYRANVVFDTTTANAVLHAMPLERPPSLLTRLTAPLARVQSLVRMHPLTLCFVLLFFLNLCRHAALFT